MESSRYAVSSPAPPPPAQSEAELVTHTEPTESPIYASDPMVDEFAQTRPPDDLFDDDFTPIAQSEPVLDPPTQSAPLIQEAEQIQLLREPPRGPRGRGRGRGRGGVGTGRVSPPRVEAEPPKVEAKAEDGTADAIDVTAAPKVERKEGAVRGDRSGTGGIKKAKLTEDELSARLTAMSLKNAALLEAHARSIADQESFEAREAVALQRRKEERVNRQQMMGEREKNRMRKLQAVGGREWDMEKNEEDFRNTENDRKARRGAHGGIGGSRYANAAPTTPAQGEDLIESYNIRGPSERGRGRGRGGRGGRGRGGHDNNGQQQQQQRKPQAPPKSSDFPDLPAATAKKEEEVKVPAPLSFPIKPQKPVEDKSAAEKPKLDHTQSFGLSSPSGEKKSWADQVEGG